MLPFPLLGLTRHPSYGTRPSSEHGILDSHCSSHLTHGTFKVRAVVTDAVPSPVTAAVTGKSFFPALEILSPVVF